jgi:hypothetical protein
MSLLTAVGGAGAGASAVEHVGTAAAAFKLYHIGRDE